MSLSCVLEEGLSMWRSRKEGREEDGLRENSGQRVERGDREEKRELFDVINVIKPNPH